MGKPTIKLYFDVVSPFGYLAYYMLRHSTVFRECDITYTPILLGGIMKTTGNRPPLEIMNKNKWINVERKRWAHLFDIPIADDVPDGFPVSTLAIQRALTAITLSKPDALPAAADACYHAFWVERNEKQIQKPENLAKVLATVLGESDAKSVIEKASANETKQTLNKRGEEAIAEGMFGVPYFIATNADGDKQAFWGFDHFGQVCYHLGIEKPKANPGNRGWQAML